MDCLNYLNIANIDFLSFANTFRTECEQIKRNSDHKNTVNGSF